MKLDLEKIKRLVLNFIFPRRCVICDDVLSFGLGVENEYICHTCKDKLAFIDDLSCKKCGAKLNYPHEKICERCAIYELPEEKGGKTSYYDYGFGLCRYVDAIKESIHRLKYQNRPEYIEFYGKCIATRFKDRFKKMIEDSRVNANIIKSGASASSDTLYFVPVPIHKDRMRERNYNQAEILSNEISKELKKYDIDIPVNTKLIVREKKTGSLNQLSELDRVMTLKNAFKVKNAPNENGEIIKSVCIVDDIYTTGSTIETMSKILKENGVEHIYFVTIAVVDNL